MVTMILPKMEKMNLKKIHRSDVIRRAQRSQASATPATGIAASIAMYRLKEIALFELVERQETVAMEMFAKGGAPEKAIPEKKADGRARPIVPEIQTGTNVKFINGEHATEIAQINELEHQIDAASTQVNQSMFQILDMPPLSHSDAKAKLRFISSMFLDGADIEANYMSHLIDECIDALDRQLETEPQN
jgi:hypothetical protein